MPSIFATLDKAARMAIIKSCGDANNCHSRAPLRMNYNAIIIYQICAHVKHYTQISQLRNNLLKH